MNTADVFLGSDFQTVQTIFAWIFSLAVKVMLQACEN